MKCLFWNTNKEIINDYVVKLSVKNDYDMIILAEYEDDVNDLLKKMQSNKIIMYKIMSNCKRIKILSKSKPNKIKHCNETEYYTIKILEVNKNEKQIIGAVHLPSKLYAKDEDRRIEIADMVSNIEKLECKYKTNNTIIVGDFNADPFEGCMTKITGLHSVSSKDVALKIKRIVKQREYNMFYNPMWNKFGDFQGVAGTYYYAGSTAEEIFWHIFDQVIIRPQLISRFEEEKLNIIIQIEDDMLVKNNTRIMVSDHLPIEFSVMEV